MISRISRVVFEVASHTRVARELSVGLYEALNVLARGTASRVESAFEQHDAAIRAELPGF